MTILQIVCLNLNFVTQFYMIYGHNLVLDALQIMSEGVTVVGTSTQQFFSYIMARTSCFCWNDDDVRFVLEQQVSWIFIVLDHWNNSPWVDMSLYSDLLFWFWANQSLLLLLNAACLAEKQQILIL